MIGIQDDGGVPGSVAFAPDPVLEDGLDASTSATSTATGCSTRRRRGSTARARHTVAAGLHTNTATAFAMFHGVSPAVFVSATDVANVFGTRSGSRSRRP